MTKSSSIKEAIEYINDWDPFVDEEEEHDIIMEERMTALASAISSKFDLRIKNESPDLLTVLGSLKKSRSDSEVLSKAIKAVEDIDSNLGSIAYLRNEGSPSNALLIEEYYDDAVKSKMILVRCISRWIQKLDVDN